jgi:hypothetical protein
MIGIVWGHQLRRTGGRSSEDDNDACLFLDERLRHLGISSGVVIGEAEIEAQVAAVDIP